MAELTALYQTLTQQYGLEERPDIIETDIDGVRYFYCSDHLARSTVAYEPGLVLLGSGKKVVYLDQQTFSYSAGHHLLLTVPMSLECETVASKDEPVQGLFIQLNMAALQQMVQAILTHAPNTFHNHSSTSQPIAPQPTTGKLLAIEKRLLETLQSPLDAQILGAGIVNELLYALLLTPYGQNLYQLVAVNSQYGKIAKTINFVQEDLSTNHSVEALASHSGMSVSAFHRAFKDVTQSSPLQYIKKMKLLKARSLIADEGLNVSLASQRVGYESAAQFSREFKRLFQTPPSLVGANIRY